MDPFLEWNGMLSLVSWQSQVSTNQENSEIWFIGEVICSLHTLLKHRLVILGHYLWSFQNSVLLLHFQIHLYIG